MAYRISNARRPSGLNKYGAPVGLGQQRAGSPFLDSPEPEADTPEPETPEYIERPAYNANEASERRTSPYDNFRGEDARAPISAPQRLNPALDSAITGNSANRVRQDFARQQSDPAAQAGGIDQLYQGTAPKPSPAVNAASNALADSRLLEKPSAWSNMRNVAGAVPGVLQNRAAPQSSPEQQAPLAPSSAPTSPSVPEGLVPGGAAARYGTANIPGAENVAWGDTSRLRGFNTAEWGAGGTEGYEDNSTKNTFGKIASRYDPRAPNATQQILSDPEFQKYFPEARLIPHPKGDQIDFGDGKPVDVLINAREGGAGDAWAFQTMGGGVADMFGGAMGGDMFGGTGMDMYGTDTSDAFMLTPEDEAFSEQLRRIIESGQLEGLDQAILGKGRTAQFIDTNEDGVDDRDQPELFSNSAKFRRRSA